MKGKIIFLAIAIFCSTAFAQKIPIKNVAVVETDLDEQSGAAKGLNRAEVREITAVLRREAVRALPKERFNVMTSETVQAQGSAVLAECAEENCVIALGSKIGADYIVRGIISKFQTRFSLTVEIYETEDGNLVAVADAVRSTNLDELLEKSTVACAAMYADFLRKFGRSVAAPASTPAPAAKSAPAPLPTHTAESSQTDFGDDKTDIEMTFVKGGTFTMGCTREQGNDCRGNEKPARSVTVDDFYIGKYEITQKQWVQVMGGNPSRFNGDSLPVENVSWNDVQEFIGKLNSITGMEYRLPTEAEWEYAARGGLGSRSFNFKYAGSNNVGDIAWYWKNSRTGKYRTNIVGTKAPNGLGIHDMSGNVWEWVGDRYGNYKKTQQLNPSGSPSGSRRVFRGGGWYSDAWYCRVSARHYFPPNKRRHELGFRLALSAPHDETKRK
jgi:formylglycine-generating enzyme required for sulfatase activity